MVVDHTQRRAQLSTHGTHGVLLLLVTIGHVTGKPRFGEGALAMLAADVLGGTMVSFSVCCAV